MQVRVKRCGKSAPPRQQCSGQGKPHTEQDQIGRERGLRSRHVPARCVKPSGRSLEPRSNAWPRGMTVPPEQSGGQNSAYRSGCHNLPQLRQPLLPSFGSCGDSEVRRSGNCSRAHIIIGLQMASGRYCTATPFAGDTSSSQFDRLGCARFRILHRGPPPSGR